MFSARDRSLVSLFAFLFALGALLTWLLVSLYNLDLLSQAADAVERTDRARSTLDDFVDALTDAETGQRGYLLTGDPSYLEPYHTGLGRLAVLESELVGALSVVGIERHDEDLEQLMELAHERRDEMRRTIRLFEDDGGRAALNVVLQHTGLRMMRGVKKHQRALRGRIAARSNELEISAEDGRHFATISTMLTGMVSILVLALTFFVADRENLLRRLAQGQAEAYARRLTELAEVGLQLNRARDRPSLLGMASAELRRLLGVEVAAIVVHQPEDDSAVSVGMRARSMATWKPDEEPLAVGLAAEEACGFTAAENEDAPAVIRGPEDLGEVLAIALTDRRGESFGHLVAAEPRADTMDAVAQLSLVQLAQSLSVAWENVVLLEELQQAAMERESFMAMLGHELRNPLNAISGAAQILALRIDDEDPLREVVAMLHRQAAFMRKLVDDLLDVSRLERGVFEIERKNVDLTALVRRVADDFRTGRSLPEDLLRVEVPTLPLFVSGSPSRLGQCLNNLLDNAAKFGEAEPIELTVHSDGRWAVVTVRDHGQGIEESELERIFERYAQGEGPARREGLGLGLALVQGLVEMQDGEVSVSSDGPGTGATFTMRFPTIKAVTEDSEPLEVAPQTRTILVVDDREDARIALRELLENDGHTVFLAEGGREALERSRSIEGLSVVFCDISMGDGPDGYEVARTLREREKGEEATPLHLVALTGFGTHVARERSFDAGFDVHLTKPVDLQVLRRTLAQLDES